VGGPGGPAAEAKTIRAGAGHFSAHRRGHRAARVIALGPDGGRGFLGEPRTRLVWSHFFSPTRQDSSIITPTRPASKGLASGFASPPTHPAHYNDWPPLLIKIRIEPLSKLIEPGLRRTLTRPSWQRAQLHPTEAEVRLSYSDDPTLSDSVFYLAEIALPGLPQSAAHARRPGGLNAAEGETLTLLDSAQD